MSIADTGMPGIQMPLEEIQTLEGGMLACRPALETVVDGDWVWRFARGYTGRANSLQSLNVSDVSDVEKRLAKHVQRSREFGIAPRFRVTPLAGAEIVEVLDRQGWSTISPSQVMLMSAGHLARDLKDQQGERDEKIVALAPTSKRWQDGVLALMGLSSAHENVYREMMEKLPVSAQGLVVQGADGGFISAVLIVVAKEVGCLFSLVTAPARRRQGLGRNLTRFALGKLKELGAKDIALQVEADNASAINLYGGLGFETVYTYHYRLEREAT